MTSRQDRIGRPPLPRRRLAMVAMAVACATTTLWAAAGVAPAAPAGREPGLPGPSWIEPASISGAGDNLDPALAGGANGEAVAVWHERQPDGTFSIFASTRQPGTAWTARRRLSPGGRDTKDPAVAVARNGDILAAWSRVNGERRIVQAAFRSAGGLWSPPVDISPAARDSANPSVAFAPSGEATVVWSNSIGVQAATRGTQGAWSPVQHVSPAGEPVSNLRVEIAGDGEATAIWDSPPTGESRLIRAATRPPGGAFWEPVQTLTEWDETASQPDIAVDAEGRATAVYRVISGGEGGNVVRARTRQAGATEWDAPEDLSQLGAGPHGTPRACADAHNPQVSTDPAGQTVAIWACRTTEAELKTFVQARTRVPGESGWSETADISGPPTGTSPDHVKPQVGVNGGEAVAVWGECPSTKCIVEAATKPLDRPWSEAWSAPIEISGDAGGESPQLGVDASGNAAAAWDGGQVFVAGYDGSGPVLTDLSVPESGAAQDKLRFSVSPVDTWSRVRGVRWNFGDGDTARGREATHTYRRPGDYRVTVTAWDSLGIPSRQSSPIHIKPLGPTDPEPRPRWLAPEQVSRIDTDGTPRHPRVATAMDPAGNAVAAWEEWDSQSAHWVIEAAIHAPGGNWSEPQRLSSAWPYSYGDAVSPAVAAGPDGEMIAIWSANTGYGASVPEVSTRPAGGEWSGPVALATLGDPFTTESPQVAIARNGDAVAIWSLDDTGFVLGAIRPAGGAWGEWQSIGTMAGMAHNPRLALAPNGEATVVWEVPVTGSRGSSIWAATRRVGGNADDPPHWDPPEWITPWERPWPAQPDVAVDAKGAVTAVWVNAYPHSATPMQAITRRAGSTTWGPVQDLPRACGDAEDPNLAVDGRGDLTAVWACAGASGQYRYDRVQAATRPYGASEWSQISDLSFLDRGFSPEPRVAVDGKGNSAAVWQDCAAWDDCTIKAAERPGGETWRTPGGPWSEPHDLSPAGQYFESRSQPGADADGNFAAAWAGSVSVNGQKSEFVQAAGYDGSGPQLRGLTIPESGTVGGAIDFSVSPVDAWSGIALVKWDFGDGGSASGQSVSHTYRRSGAFKVRVKATDAQGNSTRATGNMRIRWPSVPVQPLHEAHRRPRP